MKVTNEIINELSIMLPQITTIDDFNLIIFVLANMKNEQQKMEINFEDYVKQTGHKWKNTTRLIKNSVEKFEYQYWELVEWSSEKFTIKLTGLLPVTNFNKNYFEITKKDLQALNDKKLGVKEFRLYIYLLANSYAKTSSNVKLSINDICDLIGWSIYPYSRVKPIIDRVIDYMDNEAIHSISQQLNYFMTKKNKVNFIIFKINKKTKQANKKEKFNYENLNRNGGYDGNVVAVSELLKGVK